ncbi:MAG: phosphate acyltransferase PlsX [Pseudomonadota bacterium]
MSNNKIIVAIDAMGGDYAPLSTIEGTHKALMLYILHKKQLKIEFLIYGDKNIIAPLVKKYPELEKHSKLIHSEHKVESSDRPSYALRNSKNTSMGMAINAVKQNEAHAIISSGNTGALMAIAKVALRTLPGIDRPAIIGLVPTVDHKVVALDLGANAECEANNLVQFAIMGDAFAKVILEKPKPLIGLLNIGSEDIKGNEVVKSAAQILGQQDCLNYHGFIEADDIVRGKVDVVVAEGFSGNVAIKMAEGTAYLCRTLLKKAFESSIFSKLGYLLVKKSLKQTFKKIDGRYYNGAMLVGLNGVVVKSHGGADSLAFANAVQVAIELSRNNINQKIIQEINLVQKNVQL